jgi:hypothetical protein
MIVTVHGDEQGYADLAARAASAIDARFLPAPVEARRDGSAATGG